MKQKHELFWTKGHTSFTLWMYLRHPCYLFVLPFLLKVNRSFCARFDIGFPGPSVNYFMMGSWVLLCQLSCIDPGLSCACFIAGFLGPIVYNLMPVSLVLLAWFSTVFQGPPVHAFLRVPGLKWCLSWKNKQFMDIIMVLFSPFGHENTRRNDQSI